jgi:hypothetical protein
LEIWRTEDGKFVLALRVRDWTKHTNFQGKIRVCRTWHCIPLAQIERWRKLGWEAGLDACVHRISFVRRKGAVVRVNEINVSIRSNMYVD